MAQNQFRLSATFRSPCAAMAMKTPVPAQKTRKVRFLEDQVALPEPSKPAKTVKTVKNPKGQA